MADSKITALTSIGASTDPANDPLVLVDVSDTSMAATGTTKKVTLNQLLGASGTATLASATITGDLTVDTSTLKVDSANNRVGVGTATPTNTLEVVAPAGDNIVSTFRSGDATAANNAGGGFRSISSATAANRVAQVWLDADGANFSGGDYFFIQKNGGSGTVEFNQSSNAAMVFLTNSTERMRIDSSGNLGIGVTPKSWLSSYKAIQLGYSTSLSSTTGTDFAGLSSNAYVDSVDSRWERIVSGYATQYYQNAGDGQHIWRIAGTAAADTAITWTNAMTLDASGNLGIGVTPSAWGSTYRALQIGLGTSLTGVTNDVDVNLVNNARFDGTNWKYTNSSPAERYRAASGTHYWYNAASGTAGNNITWTQAMTLDASGNLLVGKTATNYLTVGCEVKPNGAFQSTQSGSTNANTCWDTYSTGAGAYRFYVGMAGTVFATNTTISAISDARFKENVQDIDVGLGAILALKPRKFDWKDGKGKNIKGDRGFIAQEFETVFPNLIDEWKENAPEGEAPYKSVRQDLIPVLVKAIQELAAEVNALKNA